MSSSKVNSKTIGKVHIPIDNNQASQNFGTHTGAQGAVNDPMEHTIQSVLSRPKMTYFQWQTTDENMEFGYTNSRPTPVVAVDASDILRTGPFKDKASNFSYFRYGGISCRVNVNPNPFQQALGVLVWVPYGLEIDPKFDTAFSLSQIKGWPHVLLNTAEHNSCELVVPWEYWAEWVTDVAELARVGVFKFYSIYSPQGSSSGETINGNMVMHYIYPQVRLPTTAANLTQIAVQAENDMQEVVDNANGLVNRTGADLGQARGTREDRSIGMHGDVDSGEVRETSTDTSIKSFCESWAFFDYFDWKTSDTADKCLKNIPLSAFPASHRDTVSYNDSKGTAREYPVALFGHPSFAAGQFKYWRGNLEIKLDSVNTMFHSGSLLITFDPKYPSDIGRAGIYTNYTKLWSIKGNTDLAEGETEGNIIKIPFNSVNPWIEVDSILGHIHPAVANPLLAPDTVHDSVRVYLSYRIVDAEFFVHGTKHYFPDSKPRIGVLSSDHTAKVQSEFDMVPVKKTDTGDSHNNEKWTDLLQIARRPSVLCGLANDSWTTLQPFSFNLSTNEKDPYDVLSRFPDWFTTIAVAFAFYRGGIRGTVVPLDGDPKLLYSWMEEGTDSPANWTGGVKITSFNARVFSFANTRQVAVYDAVKQYYLPNPMAPTRSRDVIDSSTSVPTFRFASRNGLNSTSDSFIMISAADDMKFVRPIGLPAMTICLADQRF